MKPQKKWMAPLLAVSLVLGSTPVLGAGVDTAMKGSEGQYMTQLSTFAGTGQLGEANGAPGQASFRAPWSILPLADGTVLIADARSHLIRQWDGKQMETYAGITLSKDAYAYPIGSLLDGKKETAVFQQPKGLAADAKGNIYVADEKNHAIRKLDTEGNVTTLAGSGVLGNKDGRGSDAAFYNPQDVAVTADGTVYVADTLNHLIRKISPDGSVTSLNAPSNRIVEVVPGQVSPAGDYADGPLNEAKFNEPSGLLLDSKGNLYVSDAGNQLIRYINFSAGTVTTVAGTPVTSYGKHDLYVEGALADGAANKAKFNFPRGLALSETGGLFIADSLNHAVRYLKDGVVTTVAGEWEGTEGSRDSIDRYGSLQSPTDVAVLSDGSLLVADAYNNKLRKVTFYTLPKSIQADGTIHVVYGTDLLTFEAPPEWSDGRTMVPLRVLAETVGFTVSFDQNETTGAQTVSLSKQGMTMQLVIGKSQWTVVQAGSPDTVHEMDTAPYISADLTYVPIRFVAEQFGLQVDWDDATSTAVLRPQT